MNERVSNRVGMTQMYDIFMIYFCRRARPRLEKLQGVTGRLKTVVMFITNATKSLKRHQSEMSNETRTVGDSEGGGEASAAGAAGAAGAVRALLGAKAAPITSSADAEALKDMWYKANTRQWAGTVMAGPPVCTRSTPSTPATPATPGTPRDTVFPSMSVLKHLPPGTPEGFHK